MRLNLTFIWSFLITACLALVSCTGGVRHKHTCHPAPSTTTVVVEKGPPPHAPAHGYRHKHGNVIIVYESSLGVYVVDGHPGIYFYDGSYYRARESYWQMSLQIRGPWKKIHEAKVPEGLHRSQHAKAKKKK